MAQPLNAYFAGALFKAGDLLGNILLAEAVERQSGGDFKCVLPQDAEPRERSPRAIRDADLKALLDCDCAIFNFDGSELDSGTLVEFLFAKSLDMPCVLFRSDFRGGGDQGAGSDPWNLMCSFHPRSEVRLFDSMKVYKSLLAKRDGRLVEAFATEAAKLIVDGLRKALAAAPLEKGGSEGAKNILLWTVRSQGESFVKLCEADPAFPDKILSRKLSLRLL